MKRVVYEPPKPRTPWAWGGAILLLGTLTAGLLGAAVLLWRYIDIESVLQTADEPPGVEAVQPQLALEEPPVVQPWPAHLYLSQTSAGFFPDSTYQARLALRWDSLLTAAGASTVRLTGTGALPTADARGLLVVPAAVCLDDSEREGIRTHVRAGGNLLATWALGTRDAECRWRGFEFLEQLTGSSGAGSIEQRPTYLNLPHGSVIAAGLPPGYRVELENEPWITLRAEGADPTWSDWALNALAAPGGGPAAAAIARRTAAGGRLAWFGYRLDVAATERDRRALDRLAANAALWTSGHVVAEIEPWPAASRAAMAVTQDVEHSFGNSRRLAARFQTLGVPVTFFVVTRLVRAQPELAGLLRAAGEVGSHSVDHRQVAGRFWGTQLAAVRQAREDIEAWADVEPLGFRPPRELYDEATLETWRRQGGLYLAASNDARSAAPEVFDFGSGRTVVLPRVVDDDYTVMVVRGETRTDSLRQSLLAALGKMRRLGGLNLVTLHSQLIDSERRIEAVEASVQAARAAGDVWIASAADIAIWWLSRSELGITVRRRTDGSVRVEVRNDGGAVAAAWLRLHLPGDPSSYAAPEVGAGVLEARLEGNTMRVALPEIPAGGALELLVPRRETAVGERVAAARSGR